MIVRISPSFWSDPDIEEMPPELKLAALWMLTNSRTTLFGYVEVSPRRFLFETGTPYEGLDALCKAHPKGFVKCGAGYWIRNFISYQMGSGDKLVANNFCKGLVRSLRAYQGLPVFEKVLSAYPELSVFFDDQDSEGLTEGLPSPREERRGEDKMEEVQEKPSELALSRARRLFRMRDETQLDSSQIRAWKKNRGAVLATSDEEWLVLEWWYSSDHPDAKFRRRDLATLLNNWNGEICRAADLAARMGAKFSEKKEKGAGRVEAFDGWEAVYARVMGEGSEGIEWDRLPLDVQRRLLAYHVEGGAA